MRTFFAKWWHIIGISILIVAVSVKVVFFFTSTVEMTYYSQTKERFVERQHLLPRMVEAYGRDVTLVKQFFDGPLGHSLEIWFLRAKVLGVWMITPEDPRHLVVNMSAEFLEDAQRSPLLVQRWIEGLFRTLRENGVSVEKCSILVNGRPRRLWVGSWNLYYPIVIAK